jgi:glutamate-ammonia-ligase adenylyltransferase
MLRDSGAAAERMAHVLASSRLVAQLLEKGPEAVAMLADDAELVPRPRAVTLGAVSGAAGRHRDDPDAAALAALAVGVARPSGRRSPTSRVWSTWTPWARR